MKAVALKKGVPVFAALGLLVGVVGIVVATDRNSGFGLGAPAGVGELLIGVPGTITVPIVNTHLWRAVEIDSVAPSCGCLTVESFDTRVGPRRQGSVVLRAHTDVRYIGVTQSVEVRTSKGESLRALISVEPARPFAGWPKHVVAEESGDEAAFVIEPAYIDIVTEIVALDSADGVLPVEIDRRAGMAVIKCRRDGVLIVPREVLVTFGPHDVPNWAGTVVVHKRSPPTGGGGM